MPRKVWLLVAGMIINVTGGMIINVTGAFYGLLIQFICMIT